MNRNKWLTVVSLLGVAAIVSLVVFYASQMSVLYLKTDEVLARLDQEGQNPNQPSLVGTVLRIHGHLKEKTTKQVKGTLQYSFKIKGKSGRTIQVKYNGVLPDTFRDKAELVLEGKLLERNLYQAYSVFAKCPTKYKEEDKGKGKGKGGYGKPKPRKQVRNTDPTLPAKTLQR